jgi:hypothetical protein
MLSTIGPILERPQPKGEYGSYSKWVKAQFDRDTYKILQKVAAKLSSLK